MYTQSYQPELNPAVQLLVADGRNLAVDGGYRYSQVGTTNFSNIASAINHLNFNYEQLMTAQSVFRIVNLQGAVLMEDSAIRAQVRMR